MKPHERPHQISDEEFDREFLGSAVVGKDDDPFADDFAGIDDDRAEDKYDWRGDEEV